MSTQTPEKNKARRLVKTIRETKQGREEVSQTINRIPGDISDVQQVVGHDEDSPTLGKKLIKVGTFLVVGVPEPIVSDIAGTTLIAAGFAMNKLGKQANVRDVYKSLNENMREIARLRSEMARGTLLQ